MKEKMPVFERSFVCQASFFIIEGYENDFPISLMSLSIIFRVQQTSLIVLSTTIRMKITVVNLPQSAFL